MQIVILAAGRGTRMGSLTDTVPKPMLKIKNKPILAYKVEALPKEIDEVIFVIGYLGNQIKEYFGDFYDGRKISYVEQEKANGTGAALNLVKEIVRGDFLVMNGDDLYTKKDVENLTKHKLAVLGYEVANPRLYGIITLNEQENIKEVVEKPDINGPALAITGLYKLNTCFFDYPMTLSARGEYELTQPLALIVKDFPVVVEKATNWFPIGDPVALQKAEEIIEDFK